jgi:hypothetical protein
MAIVMVSHNTTDFSELSERVLKFPGEEVIAL